MSKGLSIYDKYSKADYLTIAQNSANNYGIV